MSIENVVQGLQILRRYYKTGYNIGAEHDVIYAYKTQEPLSDVDAQSLVDLGWFQEGVEDGSPYDPEEGWAAYV
jgi:hypothetical protein